MSKCPKPQICCRRRTQRQVPWSSLWTSSLRCSQNWLTPSPLRVKRCKGWSSNHFRSFRAAMPLKTDNFWKNVVRFGINWMLSSHNYRSKRLITTQICSNLNIYSKWLCKTPNSNTWKATLARQKSSISTLSNPSGSTKVKFRLWTSSYLNWIPLTVRIWTMSKSKIFWLLSKYRLLSRHSVIFSKMLGNHLNRVRTLLWL